VVDAGERLALAARLGAAARTARALEGRDLGAEQSLGAREVAALKVGDHRIECGGRPVRGCQCLELLHRRRDGGARLEVVPDLAELGDVIGAAARRRGGNGTHQEGDCAGEERQDEERAAARHHGQSDWASISISKASRRIRMS